MKRIKAGTVIKYIFMIILAAMFLVPVIMMLLGSVKDAGQALQFDLSWPSHFILKTIRMFLSMVIYSEAI